MGQPFFLASLEAEPPMEAIEALSSRLASRDQIRLALEWALTRGVGSGVKLRPLDEEAAAWGAVLMALQCDRAFLGAGWRARWSGATPSQYRARLEAAALGGASPDRLDSPNAWIEASVELSDPPHFLRRAVETALNSFLAPLWGEARQEPLDMPLGAFAWASVERLPDPPGPSAQRMLAEGLSRSWEIARLEAIVSPSAASARRRSL